MLVLEYEYWPDSDLSPNARVHWAVKARKRKIARRAGYFLTKPPEKPLPTDVRMKTNVWGHPPTRRKRDEDNFGASMKAFMDGVCERLGIDDSQLKPVTRDIREPIKGGKVIIEIEIPEE